MSSCCGKRKVDGHITAYPEDSSLQKRTKGFSLLFGMDALPIRCVQSTKKNPLGCPQRALQEKETKRNNMKILLTNKTPRHGNKPFLNKAVRSTTNTLNTKKQKSNSLATKHCVNKIISSTAIRSKARDNNVIKNKVKKTEEVAEKRERKPVNIAKTSKTKQNESGMSRREQLNKWRAEKGRSLKENCHPLLSRKRPLCKVVASPSYKPLKLTHITTERIPFKERKKRRHTMMVKKEEKPKPAMKERRKTMSSIAPTNSQKTPARFSHLSPDTKKTPWQNKTLSMRQRLDLWMEAKGKTPSRTPFKTPKVLKKKIIEKSPHPNKNNTEIANKTQEINIEDVKMIEEEHPKVEFNNTFTIEDLGEEPSCVEDKLTELLNKLDEQDTDLEDIQSNLDKLLKSECKVVEHADYWICKARLAAKDNDVQRVVCLLEQAYTFDAKPEEKIKEEVVTFLQKLDAQHNEDESEEIEDYFTKYAVTPGRRVHFAVNTISPLQFKSSIIRFCIIESKSFKKRKKELHKMLTPKIRLNAQIKRKIMTPVRRSVRLQKADLPSFLRSNHELVNSPSQVEDDIIDGEITFRPNKTIQTPLNNGWLVQDQRNMSSSPNDDSDEQDNNELELSFM